jgi:hypothetical protein
MINKKIQIKRSVNYKINKTPKIVLNTLYLFETRIENGLNLVIFVSYFRFNGIMCL